MANLADTLHAVNAGERVADVHRDPCGVTDEVAEAFDDLAGKLAASGPAPAPPTGFVDAEARDDLVARLSHELRTPLNAMLGWVQIARAGGLDAADLDRALETIERNVKRQAQLIADVVDVLRIASGKLTIDAQPLPLARLVSVAVDAARAGAAASGVALDVSIDETVGEALGDAVRLPHVFDNLLSNAIKFTPPGGRVKIELLRNERSALFRVTDTGRGIPKALLPRVFDLFWRGGTSSGAHRGLGLGLTIVRHLVRLHGGVVTAASGGLDRGATFEVTLPRLVAPDTAAPDRISDPARPSLLPLRALTNLHVHVVEDDEDARDLLRAVLEKYGARVTTSADPLSAIAALETEVPDVLVSDIGLPGEGGYAFIERVRARSPERGGLVPAVALTAFASSQDRERALAAGFHAHISKPVEPAALCNIVAQLAARAGHRSSPC